MEGGRQQKPRGALGLPVAPPPFSGNGNSCGAVKGSHGPLASGLLFCLVSYWPSGSSGKLVMHTQVRPAGGLGLGPGVAPSNLCLLFAAELGITLSELAFHCGFQ